MQPNPTGTFYGLLSQAFDHFNGRLFGSTLPRCMLTLQRSRNTMGYFSPERWVDGQGLKAHEIALNPAYFARHRVIDVLQTLVHEQCHLWQHVHGAQKSRPGYHNREWSEKMEAIGLVPSSTGLPGGRSTGQLMSDYPMPDGRFLAACYELCNGEYRLEWTDTEPAWQESCQPRGHDQEDASEWLLEVREQAPALLAPVPTEAAGEEVAWESVKTRPSRNKTRYSCTGCGANAWGRPGLHLLCGDCGLRFQEGGME